MTSAASLVATKRRVLSVVVAAVAVLVAAAPVATESGYYLEQDLVRVAVGGEERHSTIKTWQAAGKQRREEGDGTITILRGDKGTLWVLSAQEKTYFEVDDATIAGYGEATMAAILPEREDPSQWLQPTGKHKRIGNWDASEVRVEDRPLPGVSLSIWVSDDVPIEKSVRDSLVGSLFNGGSGAGRLLAGLRNLSGYPVAIEMTVRLGGQSVGLRQRLGRVETVVLEPSLFEVPADYTQVASPFAQRDGTDSTKSP